MNLRNQIDESVVGCSRYIGLFELFKCEVFSHPCYYHVMMDIKLFITWLRLIVQYCEILRLPRWRAREVDAVSGVINPAPLHFLLGRHWIQQQGKAIFSLLLTSIEMSRH